VDPGVTGAALVLLLAGDPVTPAPVAAAPTRTLSEWQTLLAREERNFEWWRWSWIAGYGALTAANLSVVPFTPDHETRVDLYVGAASSALAVVPLLVFSQPEYDAHDPECVSAEACAGATWRRIAAFQRDCQSPLMHVINLAYNAAVGAVLGFGYGHWRSAALNFGVGSLLGELQILTQPTGALRY
jgi:hypothetical protein